MNTPKDPIDYCLEALNSGQNKEVALQHANNELAKWKHVAAAHTKLSGKMLDAILHQRAVIMAVVASVYVWNDMFDEAFGIEKEFLYNPHFWKEPYNDLIRGYLMYLGIKKQFDHLNVIFSNQSFKDAFLEYEDLYKSVIDPKYEIKGDKGKFVSVFNTANNYSRRLTGEGLQ